MSEYCYEKHGDVKDLLTKYRTVDTAGMRISHFYLSILDIYFFSL